MEHVICTAKLSCVQVHCGCSWCLSSSLAPHKASPLLLEVMPPEKPSVTLQNGQVRPFGQRSGVWSLYGCGERDVLTVQSLQVGD